jgi:glc operon protein GlcG
MRTNVLLPLLAAVCTAFTVQAQTTPPAAAVASMHAVGYGAPLPLAAAKKVADAAMSEAKRIAVPSVVAITDQAGVLLYLERQDDAMLAGVAVAQEKAKSAAIYKRPTKAFEDVIGGGGSGNRVLRLAGAVPVEGGLPIVVDGKIVGAIGVSGGTGVQDGQVAKAGLEGLK